MADFSTAYKEIGEVEGGYCNDLDDVGGETYCGISRVYHPDCDIWPIVDSMKQSPMFPHNLESSAELKEKIKQFYKTKYWDTFWGDKIRSQKLANGMYDIAVNFGVGKAIIFLQKVLTVLNRNDPVDFYPDVPIDGGMGPVTFSALDKYIMAEGKTSSIDHAFNLLCWALNDLQNAHYIERAYIQPDQRKFYRGWTKRTRLDE